MKDKKQLLIEIINDKQKELVNSEFLLDFYEGELQTPKAVGKVQALESIGIHKEYNRRMNNTIKQYEDYKNKMYPELNDK